MCIGIFIRIYWSYFEDHEPCVHGTPITVVFATLPPHSIYCIYPSTKLSGGMICWLQISCSSSRKWRRKLNLARKSPCWTSRNGLPRLRWMRSVKVRLPCRVFVYVLTCNPQVHLTTILELWTVLRHLMSWSGYSTISCEFSLLSASVWLIDTSV